LTKIQESYKIKGKPLVESGGMLFKKELG